MPKRRPYTGNVDDDDGRPPKKVLVAVLARTVCHKTYVLVLVHRHTGDRCLPGGFIESTDRGDPSGDSPDRVAAIRELSEETLDVLKSRWPDIRRGTTARGMSLIVDMPVTTVAQATAALCAQAPYNASVAFSCALGSRIALRAAPTTRRASSFARPSPYTRVAMHVMMLRDTVTRRELDSISAEFQALVDKRDRCMREYYLEGGGRRGQMPCPYPRERREVSSLYWVEVQAMHRDMMKATDHNYTVGATGRWWVDIVNAWAMGFGKAVDDTIRAHRV